MSRSAAFATAVECVGEGVQAGGECSNDGVDLCDEFLVAAFSCFFAAFGLDHPVPHFGDEVLFLVGPQSTESISHGSRVSIELPAGGRGRRCPALTPDLL